jgi:hypothetical protein
LKRIVRYLTKGGKFNEYERSYETKAYGKKVYRSKVIKRRHPKNK